VNFKRVIIRTTKRLVTRRAAMVNGRVVVGVFADQDQARQARHEIQLAGFPPEHIGFVVRDEARVAQGTPTEKLSEATEIDSTTGAVTGGVVGGGEDPGHRALRPSSGTKATPSSPAGATSRWSKRNPRNGGRKKLPVHKKSILQERK
jgi:hypothetical protein